MDATLTNRPPVATKQPGQQRITEALNAYRSSPWVEAMEHASYPDSERLVAFLRDHDPEEGWGALLPLGATAEQIMYATGLDRRRYTVAMHAVESYCMGPGDKYLVVSRVSGVDAYRMMSSSEIIRVCPQLAGFNRTTLKRRLRGPGHRPSNRNLVAALMEEAPATMGHSAIDHLVLLYLAQETTLGEYLGFASLDYLATGLQLTRQQVDTTIWRLASKGLLTLTVPHYLEPDGTVQYEVHWPARSGQAFAPGLATAVIQ